MSTASNHAKRSHRSNYRARAFNGSRRSVIKPTVSKSNYFNLIKLIRNVFKKESKNDAV